MSSKRDSEGYIDIYMLPQKKILGLLQLYISYFF